MKYFFGWIWQAGVGILITARARSALMKWNPISERLIMARFKTKVRHVSIIQCYAPTEGALDDKKTVFYELLESTSRKEKKQDIEEGQTEDDLEEIS
jgi:hypothetical protein